VGFQKLLGEIMSLSLLKTNIDDDIEEKVVAGKFLLKSANGEGWQEHQNKDTCIDGDKSIVVGFDGSFLSHKALHWGVNYASAFGVKIVVVSGHEVSYYHDNVVVPHLWNVPMKQSLQKNLDYLVDKSIGTSPNAMVEKIVAFGEPAHVLAEFSRGSLLLIIGHKGQNRHIDDSDIGSVAHYCIKNADCPVLVFRERKTKQDRGFLDFM
jgi:nucleotide-binding universal stress UspA family protein